ncbi:MAG: nucleotidyl transferase AbiEii/AbiGii toxin family protein [Thermoplasmata archaeon]
MNIYEASMQTLRGIVSSGAEICVIGGWAVWAYNPYKYSMDIDIIVKSQDLWKVRDHLLRHGFNETSGGHLGKRGFKRAFEDGVVEVDAYDRMIGPFRAADVLRRSVERELFGRRTKVASATDLLVLKLHALAERKDSGKGQKDISDLIALLLVARNEIDLARLREHVQRKSLKDAIALLTASYQQTSRFYPLTMAEYKKFKNALEKWIK